MSNVKIRYEDSVGFGNISLHIIRVGFGNISLHIIRVVKQLNYLFKLFRLAFEITSPDIEVRIKEKCFK